MCDAAPVTWAPTDLATLQAQTGQDAFVRYAAGRQTLTVTGPQGWACLLPWRPHGHWGGAAVVAADAPPGAESEAFALLCRLADEQGVTPEWFSTVPGRPLSVPAGLEKTGSGEWAFLSTTAVDGLPALGGLELVELDDTADAEEIETFARAHNPDFEGFPGRGFATLWLASRDATGLTAVGALHELASGAPHLSGLVVRTDLRGQGLGALVTAELTRRAVAATGVCTLGVYSANSTALRLYGRLGYAVAHHFRTRSLRPRVDGA